MSSVITIIILLLLFVYHNVAYLLTNLFTGEAIVTLVDVGAVATAAATPRNRR